MVQLRIHEYHSAVQHAAGVVEVEWPGPGVGAAVSVGLEAVAVLG